MANNIEKFIDWDKFEATSEISKRTNGVTKGVVEQEVELWEKQLQILEPLDYQKIFKETESWDISIPHFDSLTFENIASTYSKLVNYKLRASVLLAASKTWRETAETACKYLEELSQGAFTGTGADKKSNAMHVIQPFVHLKIQASRIENYLNTIHSSILFCATQLDLLIKEKQSRAKFNSKLALEGEYILSNSSDAKIVEEDENGETWTTIQKSKKFF